MVAFEHYLTYYGSYTLPLLTMIVTFMTYVSTQLISVWRQSHFTHIIFQTVVMKQQLTGVLDQCLTIFLRY